MNDTERHDNRCVLEYVRCIQDGDMTRAGKIWNFNTDLHDKFLAAVKAEGYLESQG